jgi:two-component system, cell cycle response regulator
MPPRLTRSVFSDLAIWMVGLGLMTGVAFPPMVLLLGVAPPAQALTPRFFAACIAAGLTVGAVNWALSRTVIGSRLRALTERMRHIGATIHHATETGDWSGYDSRASALPTDSDDELGDTAAAFNELVAALGRSRAVEDAVHDLTGVLSSHLDLDGLAGAALERLLSHLDAPAGAVAIARESDGAPAVVAARALGGTEALERSGAVAEAMRAAAPTRIAAPAGLTRVDDAGVEDVLIVPVRLTSRTGGAVVLATRRRRLSGEQRRLVAFFAQAFGVALDNALAHGDSQRQARLDALTGCSNRRAGVEFLEAAYAEAAGRSRPLGALMIDLDHFKSVNDGHGHAIGDEVLQRAAAAARACLRQTDALVRYGGEEFLVVLPDADETRLPQIAERIRAAVEATTFVGPRGVVRVSASIGAAAIPACGATSADRLLEYADEALYAAKVAGRNRVVLAAA